MQLDKDLNRQPPFPLPLTSPLGYFPRWVKKQIPSNTNRAGSNPPMWFWLLPLTVAFLRTLPFLWLQITNPPEGMAFYGVGFIPKDFLSYLSFINQVAQDGSFVFYDAYTTDPQLPRFILLFHWFLGLICWVTGLSANWVLELSRFPLIMGFFWLLWRFMKPILPDEKDRLWAGVLVAFSGGVEGFLRLFPEALPAFFANPFWGSTWAMYGWNSFAAFFNPLWTAALIPALCALHFILKPEEPQRVRDWVCLAASMLLAYFIHPYTGIFLIAVAATKPAIALLVGRKVAWLSCAKMCLLIALFLGFVAIVSQWQSQQVVYRNAAAGIFGSQELSVFWYPFTLGFLGFAAIRGAFIWAATKHPYRFSLLAWVIAVVILHTCPILNGYKFAYLLHIPLCIVAAPAVRKWVAGIRHTDIRARGIAVISLLLIISPAVFTLVESIGRVERENLIPADYTKVVSNLAGRPKGNALTPWRLGNMIPAYTHHQVWLGQWFLTPDFVNRASAYESLTSDPSQFDNLSKLLNEQKIDFLVVPANRTDLLVEYLGSRVAEKVPCGQLDLLVLGR